MIIVIGNIAEMGEKENPKYRFHRLIADMINNMGRLSHRVQGFVCIAVFLLLPAVLSADDLAADSSVRPYRTGTIDPKCVELPVPLQRLLDFNASSGIARTVKYLQGNTDNPYRIVKRIHDWIVHNIDFINTEAGTASAEEDSVLSAVRTKAGSSWDFARLFERMCGEAGIDAKVIRGMTNRYSTAEGLPAVHFWNGVWIDGRWYIVDAAEDAREGYSDKELFILPAAKVLTHLPEDDRYQFLETPVSRRQFFSRPLFNTGLVKYGIIPLEGFEERAQRMVSVEDGKLQRRQDVFPSQKPILTFRFFGPEHIDFYPVLRDMDGKIYRRHAFTYMQNGASQNGTAGGAAGTTSVTTFSLPGEEAGYEASIVLRNTRTGEREELYSCLISNEDLSAISSERRAAQQIQFSQHNTDLPQNPLLPEKNRVYTKAWLARYGCRIPEDAFKRDTAAPVPFRSLTIDYPEDMVLRGVLEDVDGRKFPEAVHNGFAGVNRVRYYAAGPAPGRYFLKIEGKKEGAGPFYRTLAVLSFFEHAPRPAGLLPSGENLFSEHYFRQDFRLLADNFHRLNEEGCYRMLFRAPEGYRMNCSCTGPDGEALPGAAVYERYGDLYYCYFLPPESRNVKAEIYSIDGDGNQRTVSEILLEPPPAGAAGAKRYAYTEGWLYRKNGLEDLGVRVRYEHLHGDGGPGYAIVDLEKPADVRLTAAYETLEGTDLRKGNIIVSSPDIRRKSYYFRLPNNGPVKVTIFGRHVEGPSAGSSVTGAGKHAEPREAGYVKYDIPLLDFMLFPDPAAAPSIPPFGEIVFYEQFHLNGFEYISDTLQDAFDDSGDSSEREFELQVRRPGNAELSCKLFRQDGTEVPGAVLFKVREDRYIFTIRPPAGEKELTGRVFYYNREGQWQTMCWFPLQ